MWRKTIIPTYRLWLHGLYGPWCPLSPKRPINIISLSLRHHGGCGWPGSRWTSVHQQPSDWFNHCIVMFPCREINGSLHLQGPYASSQPQYEFQPCDHRTCVSPVSLGRLLLYSTFFSSMQLQAFRHFHLFMSVLASVSAPLSGSVDLFFYASVFRRQRHFWGTHRSGLKFGMMYPDHIRNQLDLHHVLFIFLILAQLQNLRFRNIFWRTYGRYGLKFGIWHGDVSWPPS